MIPNIAYEVGEFGGNLVIAYPVLSTVVLLVVLVLEIVACWHQLDK